MIRRRRPALIALALALAVGIGGVGRFVLPQRDRANSIEAEISRLRTRVAAAGDFAKAYRPEALDSADLFRLSKAMPSFAGMPDLLLQLERVAANSGVTLDSVAPGHAVRRKGYRTVPIDLTAHGSFYAVSDFLLRLRSAVRVRGANLDVNGRLFAVESLTLAQPTRGRDLTASLTVSAFAFDGSSVPATPSVGAVG